MRSRLLLAAACLTILCVASCSEPQDPTLAFLESQAEAPFERIYGMARRGDHYRWRTPLYEQRFNRVDEEEDLRRALDEMMTEIAAFASGEDISKNAEFARLCAESEIRARERYYLLPIDAVRPGARKRLGRIYRQVSEERFREDRQAQAGPSWPPTHGPYLQTSWVAPPDPDEAPFSQCLNALFRFSPQSDTVRLAALARAQDMERRALEATASLAEVMQLGSRRLVAGSGYDMKIVFYSAEKGWAEAEFRHDQWGPQVAYDARVRTVSENEVLDARALQDCGFTLGGGGNQSLWESLCLRTISGTDDDLSGHLDEMRAFVDAALKAPVLRTNRSPGFVQPRDGGV